MHVIVVFVIYVHICTVAHQVGERIAQLWNGASLGYRSRCSMIFIKVYIALAIVQVAVLLCMYVHFLITER
jgi:hypothetical protein